MEDKLGDMITGKDSASTDVDTVSGSALTSETRSGAAGQVRLSSEMEGDVVNEIREKAPKVLAEFKKNRNSLDSFGQDSFKKLNSQVDACLNQYRNETGAGESKEVMDILRSMTGKFDDVTKDYGTFAIDKPSHSITRWVRSKFNGVRKWNYDRKDLLEKFDMAEAELAGTSARMSDNITRSEIAIAQNREAQYELIKLAIAMELVRDLADNEVSKIEQQQSGLERTELKWNDLQQQKALLATIIHGVDEKHTEYVSAIFSAYYTAEQMTNIIQLSQGMKSKTNHIINTNIPDMKRVISQIDMMMQARNSAEVGDRVRQADRKINELGDEVMVDGTAYVSSVVESPTTTPEQIQSKVESMIKQNDEIVSAIEEGSKKRLEVEKAAIDGINRIGTSVRSRNDKVVNAMLGEITETAKITARNADQGKSGEPDSAKKDDGGMDVLEADIIGA